VDNRECGSGPQQAGSVYPLPPIAGRQCGVFSTYQARSDGWSQEALRHAVRSDRIVRLRVGAYQAVDLDEVTVGLSPFEVARWRHAAPAIGAVLTTPGALASHSTAAVLRGMPLIFLPERSCLSVVPWLTGAVPHVHLHRCTSPPRSFPIAAVDCTSDERILIDLAREHGVASGVVATDYALHVGLTTYGKLYAELDRCVRWPGVRAAREAIAFADRRSESVLESRSRLALRDWGIPAPEPQVRIGNEWGGFVARVDFYWDEFGVVGEADGDMKYDGTDPTPLLDEKKRQGLIEDLDLPVVRWGTDDLRNFGAVAARLRRTFSRAVHAPRTARRWTVLPRL
jgi:hypothetical protein